MEAHSGIASELGVLAAEIKHAIEECLAFLAEALAPIVLGAAEFKRSMVKHYLQLRECDHDRQEPMERDRVCGFDCSPAAALSPSLKQTWEALTDVPKTVEQIALEVGLLVTQGEAVRQRMRRLRRAGLPVECVRGGGYWRGSPST